jgi:predicted lipid-binding transport protein (Tim44 family)
MYEKTFLESMTMKLSWNSLKISIAGARLSHLVQKDSIWDHGSMVEQVKTIFFKLKRIKSNGNIEDLKKYLTTSCYENLKRELDELERNGKIWVIKNLVIKEVAVIEVSEGKNKKPDCFTSLIKAIGIEFIADKDKASEITNYSDHVRNFSEQWSFIRQGDWWLLDEMR